MSIESVFSKLQTQRRKQYEDIAKRRSREAVVDTFANVGGTLLKGVINDTLRERTTNFINSAPVMNERMQFKVADANRNRIQAVQNKIDNSGKSTSEYFFDTYRGSFEEQIKDQLAERKGEDWRDIASNPDVYDAQITTQMRGLAEALAANHNEAYALAQQVGTTDDFNAVVSLATKNARPANVGSFLSRGIRSMYTGKTKEDYDLEAVEAITNGPLSKNATALNDFMEQYEETKDVVNAYNYTYFVNQLDEPETKEKVDVSNDTITVNDKVVKRTTTKTTNIFTGETSEDIAVVELLDLNVDGVDGLSKLATELRTRFDHQKEAGTDFNADGRRELVTLVNKQGIDITNIRTGVEYSKVGKIYSTLLEREDLIKDDIKAAERQGIVDILATEMGDIDGIIARLMDIENEDEKMTEMRKVMNDYFGILQLVDGEEFNRQGR